MSPEDPDPKPADDKGYPEGTPIADMTDAQRAAYYKDQNKHTDRLRGQLSAFNGFTPDDVHAMWTRLQEVDSDKLSADEKAVRDAAEKAAQEARAATESEWKPKLLSAQLESAAGLVIKDPEQLASFMAITDPGKFTGDDGQIDRQKVRNSLTPLFGAASGGTKWGQHGSRPPGKSASDEGLAEARRRGYIKDKE